MKFNLGYLPIKPWLGTPSQERGNQVDKNQLEEGIPKWTRRGPIQRNMENHCAWPILWKEEINGNDDNDLP